MRSVQLSAVMRRAMVCTVLCAAIVIVAKVRVSESDGCACAVLLMCALAAGDGRGAPASSEAQAAIARVSIPFALITDVYICREIFPFLEQWSCNSLQHVFTLVGVNSQVS